MKKSLWRSVLPGLSPGTVLRSWLQEPASLTRRLQSSCKAFRVEVKTRGLQPPLIETPDSGTARQQVLVREVMLFCDSQPVIFARTEMSTARRGRLALWLQGLGSRSLGSLLFSYPRFVRGPIEYHCLDQRDPLYQRLARKADEIPARLWARRSRHQLGQQSVLVTEVFLPAILDLEQPAKR